MAITVTILQQQFDDLRREVQSLSRLFESFRGYVNKQFAGIHERLDAIERQMGKMATKDDITNMVVKDDLKDVATKDDIVRLERFLQKRLG